MRHDPERNAAAYLGGTVSGRRRRAFERHIVECEECWREVQLGRSGRALAEAAKELAPQALRERVRATVDAASPPRRRPHVAFAAAALAAAASLGFLALPEDPREIAAAVTSYQEGDDFGPSAPRGLPGRLGALRLVSAERGRLGDFAVVAHRYEDPGGDEIVVYIADEEWPVAHGAEHDDEGETWTALKDGLVLVCLNEPAPALVVGHDLDDVERAALALRR